jgi:hypothetical protein
MKCRGCGLRAGVAHRANLCVPCQEKAGETLIVRYIAAAMALRSGRFTPGEYEAASQALDEALS